MPYFIQIIFASWLVDWLAFCSFVSHLNRSFVIRFRFRHYFSLNTLEPKTHIFFISPYFNGSEFSLSSMNNS